MPGDPVPSAVTPRLSLCRARLLPAAEPAVAGCDSDTAAGRGLLGDAGRAVRECAGLSCSPRDACSRVGPVPGMDTGLLVAGKAPFSGKLCFQSQKWKLQPGLGAGPGGVSVFHAVCVSPWP